MLVKLLYSALLVIIALAAAGELWRVWTDRRLYIGAFDVASAEGDADEKGKAFGVQVVLAHTLIFRQLQDYNMRGAEGASDTTYNIAPHEQAVSPNDKLDDLALTYQNVNIGHLLSMLRKSLVQPDEVGGVVTKVDGKLWAKVSWPRAPDVGGITDGSFLTDIHADEGVVTRQVACGIAWAQVVARRSPIADPTAERRKAAIADMGRHRFCQWVEALGVYSSFAAGSAEVDHAGIARRRALLKEMALAGVRFPDIYRLRADLTELLPAEERLKLLEEAQNDRLTYALLTDPEILRMPPEQQRLQALILARPAILISDGRLAEMRENWRAVLQPHAAPIERAARAVGTLGHADLVISHATAFRIGRDLIMTVDHALSRSPAAHAESNRRTAAQRVEDLYFCESNNLLEKCPNEKRFAVTELVYQGGEDSSIAVLRIADRGPVDFLQLRDTTIAPTALIAQYAYIIGYPTRGMHPTEPPPALLPTTDGRKHLMPGRTLALEIEPRLSRENAMITTDITTAPGTGGGPLVDLVSGRVIGVHLGGRWDDNRGKFTFAEIITPALIAELQSVHEPLPTFSDDSAQPG